MGIHYEEESSKINTDVEEKKPSDTKHLEEKKVTKTKHIYTEEESKNLLDKVTELKKQKKVKCNNFSLLKAVYSSKDEKISAHLIDFTKSIESNEDIDKECLVFQTNCFCCNEQGENKMCICTIPYFKEIIITCFKCEKCGFKTADVKGGGGFSDKATKMILRKEKMEDLNRDVFKSETAKIAIPELEFETDTGSLGGMFTTVEGVLTKILDNLENIPFSFGDSNENSLMENFLNRFRRLLTEDIKFTLIIDDPLSNSFIFSPLFPNKDPQLDVIEYERSYEQNEELGINDMKVDNYDHPKIEDSKNSLFVINENVEQEENQAGRKKEV